MTRSFIAAYVSPWALSRDRKLQQRVAALRERDGDACRRCRRPIRFDLPSGHEKGPRIEPIAAAPEAAAPGEDFCLCHGRCNVPGADNTDEVTERIRRKAEAAVLSKPRKARKRA